MSDEYKLTLNITPNSKVSKSPFDAGNDLDETLSEIWDDFECGEVYQTSIGCDATIHLTSGPPTSATIQNEGRIFHNELQTRIRKVLPESHIESCFINEDQCNFNFKE